MGNRVKDRNVDSAKRLLIHYFQVIAKKSGVVLDVDCISEIGEIVDCIVAASVAAAVDKVGGTYDLQIPE